MSDTPVFVCPLSQWERAGVREDKPCLSAIR